MRTKAVALLGLGLALGACGTFDAPDQTASTTADLTGTPNKVVATSATALR